MLVFVVEKMMLNTPTFATIFEVILIFFIFSLIKSLNCNKTLKMFTQNVQVFVISSQKILIKSYKI